MPLLHYELNSIPISTCRPLTLKDLHYQLLSLFCNVVELLATVCAWSYIVILTLIGEIKFIFLQLCNKINIDDVAPKRLSFLFDYDQGGRIIWKVEETFAQTGKVWERHSSSAGRCS